MNIIFRTVLCAVVFQITGCQLYLSIKPKETEVEAFKNVTIRCSLNLHHTKTDRVYSIMLKRRGMTVAVLLTHGAELPHKRYIVDGTLSPTSPGSAYLQVTFSNVTCSDRGNYSCRMAVRRSYNNMQLGPVYTSFTVIGKPSQVSSRIRPRKQIFTIGEDVRFTCSALEKSTDVHWLWNLTSPPRDKKESCLYSESDCLYRCSSTVSHPVSWEDMLFDSKCGLNGNFQSFKLNVTKVKSDPLIRVAYSAVTGTKKKDSESITPETSVGVTSSEVISRGIVLQSYKGRRSPGQRVTLTYSFISAFCVTFICIFVYIFASDRCKLCKVRRQRREEECHRRNIHGQRHESRSSLVLIPVTEHCRFSCDNPLNESDYPIPQNYSHDRTALSRNDPQSQNMISRQETENLYEEIGRKYII